MIGQVRTALVSILMAVTLAGCGGSGNSPAFKDASEVYSALVNRLDGQDKVLHAKMTSTPLNGSDQSTFDFWIDEARDLARKDEDIANVFPKGRKVLIVDGSAYSFVGGRDAGQWKAPSCEGISAPATSLLLGCQGVAGAHSELMNDGGKTLRIVTTGSDGPDIDNKPWSITLTLDADSLMPISGESDLWGLLNASRTKFVTPRLTRLSS